MPPPQSARRADLAVAFYQTDRSLVNRAATERRLVLLDAEEVLDGIIVDGPVSTDAFRESVGRIAAAMTRASPRSSIAMSFNS